MKAKLAFLLIIIGGVIASRLPFPDLPMILTSTIGAFLLSFSYFIYAGVDSGIIWGIKINSSGG